MAFRQFWVGMLGDERIFRVESTRLGKQGLGAVDMAKEAFAPGTLDQVSDMMLVGEGQSHHVVAVVRAQIVGVSEVLFGGRKVVLAEVPRTGEIGICSLRTLLFGEGW